MSIRQHPTQELILQDLADYLGIICLTLCGLLLTTTYLPCTSEAICCDHVKLRRSKLVCKF